MRWVDDADARRYLPHQGHWDQSTVVDAHGALYCAFRVTGQFAQLAAVQDVMQNLAADDKVRQGISAPGVELWSHFVRMPGRSPRALPPVGTWAGARLDQACHDQAAARPLFENALYRTVVQRRPRGLVSAVRALFTPPQRFVQVPDWRGREFADLARKVEQGLTRYGVRRLGLTPPAANGAVFSETFEAWHQVANCRSMPCGVTADPMGRLIVPNRPVFGDAASPEGSFLGEHGPHFFAVLTFLRYPAGIRPIMLDDLMEMPFGLVVTNAERFEMRQTAVDRMQRRMNQKQSVRGAGAAKQLAAMSEEQQEIETGESVPVQHHFSIAVHASSIEDLNRHVSRVSNLMAEQGVTLTRQREAIKAAFYTQLPANFDWSPCSAPAKSRNTAALAMPNGVSPGRARGRWGAPALLLRTTLETEYPLHLHIPASKDVDEGDRGNIRIQGPPGTGKTVLVNSIVNGTLRVPRSRVFCVDNRRGMSVNIVAQGGSYAELVPGRPCCSLLRSLDATPENLTHIKAILLGAIKRDGHGPVSSLEDERLSRAVARQMRMEPHERSLWGVHAMLPSRKRDDGKDSAADRLRPWCRGQERGWALDAEQDMLDLSTRVAGCDTTLLLKDEMACGPVTAAVLHRVGLLANGDPFLLVIDEAWQIDLQPELAGVVGHSLATIRKDEGVVLLATQMPESYSGSKLAAAYRNQVPTSIWYADAGADRTALAREHHMTAAEIEVVTEQLPNMPHCFLLKRPGESIICRFDLSGAPQALAVLSARRKTYDLMRSLQARHGTAPEQWLPHYERLAPGLAADPIGARDEPADLPATPVLEAAE